MPLEFEIMPERGIANDSLEFSLGMPFQFAVTSLRKQHLTVKTVNVIFNETEPLVNDLVLCLPSDGLRLYFDPLLQTLKVIEISDLSLINLKYCGSLISSNGSVPSLDKIDHCFGATHPGVYDAVNQVFELKFRGLQFQFPADPTLLSQHVVGLGAIQFSQPPLVSKMHVYCGNNLSEAVPPPIPSQYFYGNIFAEKVEGRLGGVGVSPSSENKLTQLKFTFLREDVFSSGGMGSAGAGASGANLLTANLLLRGGEKKKNRLEERWMCLGDSCDQILSNFGAPNKVFYKCDDKMRIHTPSGSRINDEKASHYFFNYFTLGVDLLMDGEKHILKKIILHTNYPCHYHFNIYHRCQFAISLSSSLFQQKQHHNQLRQQQQPAPHPSSGDDGIGAGQGQRQQGRSNRRAEEGIVITPSTRWTELSDMCSHDKPVVLTRASCDNNTNPFGPTFCYNISNIIIEVMQNNHIASLTIFESDEQYLL